MTAVLTYRDGLARGTHGARLARLDAVGTRERGLNRLALHDLAQLGRARNERRDARMRREMARVDSGVGRRHDGDGWRVRVCAWASACVSVLGQARARARARVCSRGSSTKLDGRDGKQWWAAALAAALATTCAKTPESGEGDAVGVGECVRGE